MSSKKKVLVVEDNDINREMLADILAENYRVLLAENGQVALDVLKEQKNNISLILLDVQMPVMDGYTLLDRLKADAELSLIPVIVMTQSNSEEDELAALDHGATDFLPKPYRPQIILHRVASLIKLRETAAIANLLQYDRLTGLYSKDFFYQKVREYLSEESEDKYYIIGSNFVNFKLVNDTSGTLMGDRLLKEFANLAKGRLGNIGFCCRYGADRFLFFLKQEKDQLIWKDFVEFDLQEIAPVFKNIAVRWGIYEVIDRTIPVEKMCDRAFLAADRIKHQYNQSFSVYDESLRNELLREQAIISSMDTALREKQFDVYLQPKFSLSGNCMAGAEALVRWNHPEWGFMSPGEFIPLFEKNGFIPKLDQYVWEWVCVKLSEWKKKGYPIVPVSVNISRADVFHGDLVDTITSLTKKYDIEPAYLHLEITESAYTANTNQIIKAIDRLHDLGYVIEMDDFGSGYSSFNMLSQMSTDVLKLDMKFIQNELAKPADRSFLHDVISMAHRAELSVVAEGVETPEQVDRLLVAGCDYAQGYYFAKPLPHAEFEKMLTK
ncbi:MAG: putative bifunctional diguanylate cyclase/phosphodiesterase [Acetatifactor sp.]